MASPQTYPDPTLDLWEERPDSPSLDSIYSQYLPEEDRLSFSRLFQGSSRTSHSLQQKDLSPEPPKELLSDIIPIDPTLRPRAEQFDADASSTQELVGDENLNISQEDYHFEPVPNSSNPPLSIPTSIDEQPHPTSENVVPRFQNCSVGTNNKRDLIDQQDAYPGPGLSTDVGSNESGALDLIGTSQTMTRRIFSWEPAASRAKRDPDSAQAAKRRRLNPDLQSSTSNQRNAHLSDRAETFLKAWLNVFPIEELNRSKLEALSLLIEYPAGAVVDWLQQNGYIHPVATSISSKRIQSDSVHNEQQQESEVTCKVWRSQVLNWQEPKVPSKPLSCTHKCGQTFSKRGDWERHENINYDIDKWICWKARCRISFRRRDKLREHVQNVHSNTPSVAELELALDSNKRDFLDNCGFCGMLIRGWKTWVKHVADHFEDKLSGGPWDMSMWQRPWNAATRRLPKGSGHQRHKDQDHRDDDDTEDDDDGQDHGRDRNTCRSRGDRQYSGPANRSERRSEPGPDFSGRSGSFQSSSYRWCFASVSLKSNPLRGLLELKNHSASARSHRPIPITSFLEFYDPFEHAICTPGHTVGSFWAANLGRFLEDMGGLFSRDQAPRAAHQEDVTDALNNSYVFRWQLGSATISELLISTVFTVHSRIFKFCPHCVVRDAGSSRCSDTILILLSVNNRARGTYEQQRGYSSVSEMTTTCATWASQAALVSPRLHAEVDTWPCPSSNRFDKSMIIERNHTATSTAVVPAEYDLQCTESLAIHWLYAWMSDFPGRLPNPEEAKALALLATATDHSILRWLQLQLSPAIAASPSKLDVAKQDLLGHMSAFDPQNTCLVKPSSSLTWDKPRDPRFPYSCTHKCGSTFRRKGDWISHERDNVREYEWEPSTCGQQNPFMRKIKGRHSIGKPQKNVTSPSDDGSPRNPGLSDTSTRCGFCGFACGSWREWTRHVGAHFEDRIGGGPWVMRRWKHPWVDEEDERDLFFDDDFDNEDSDSDDDNDGGDRRPASGGSQQHRFSGPTSCSSGDQPSIPHVKYHKAAGEAQSPSDLRRRRPTISSSPSQQLEVLSSVWDILLNSLLTYSLLFNNISSLNAVDKVVEAPRIQMSPTKEVQEVLKAHALCNFNVSPRYWAPSSLHDETTTISHFLSLQSPNTWCLVG